MGRVSVVIPCYNNGETITRAVESVFSDSYTDTEVIIVNDGSTDDSFEILQLLKARYPEQLSVIDQVNKGANAARNVGLKLSQGAYVQFLDADDYLVNDKLARSVELMKANDQLCCVYCDGITGNNDVVIQAAHKNAMQIADKDFVEFTFGMNTNMPLWKTVFLKSGGEYWDESLGCWNESDYYLRLLLQLNSSKEMHHLELKGFVRTINKKGISGHSNSVKYILSKAQAIEKIIGYCHKKGVMNESLRAQSDRFMWLLFKQSVLNRLDLAIPQLKAQHCNKTTVQRLIYCVPTPLLRIMYKLVSRF